MQWERHEKEEEEEKKEKEERRGEREGTTKETSTKEADSRKHRNGNGKSLITMYYQCMATCTGKVFTKTVAT